MIDDFVRPDRKRPSPFKKSNSGESEDFMPDLSQNPPTKPQKDFVTPDEAAATDSRNQVDDVIDMGSAGGDNESQSPKEPKDHWWKKIGPWFASLNKKQKAFLIFGIIVLLIAISGGAYALTRPESEPVKPAAKKAAPKPTTVANTLTGREVQPEINQKPVTAVIVENSTDARPQSGLYDAGVVFEAIAEGGITRFLALYQDTEPESIGPIRSIRPYYIDWAAGFDAPVAHVGGSPEALARIKNEGIKDLDQSFNPSSYQRVTSKFAPHNVYSSIGQLNKLEDSKGYTKSDFTGFERKKDEASKAPTAKTVNLNISSAKYNVQYAYDAATNSYLRNLAGAPHQDEAAQKQINPKVVVAMVMQYSIQADGKHSQYNTVGSGAVTIFQDGIATTGTWSKTSKTGQITFVDSTGKPIKLNAGQTWITMVNNSGSIVATP